MVGFESSRLPKSNELVNSTPEAVTGRQGVVDSAVGNLLSALSHAGVPITNERMPSDVANVNRLPDDSIFTDNPTQIAEKAVYRAYESNGDFALAE